MPNNLAGFIKSLLPNFSKDDVETDLEISLEYIPVILDSYAAFNSNSKVLKVTNKDSKKLIETLYKELSNTDLKVKLSNNKSLGADTVTLFSNAKVNGEVLLKEISDSLNDVVMSQALTAYNANLLRVVPHFFFMTRYALDFINYILIKEAEEAGLEADSSFKLVKKQEEFITKNMWIYARILAVYGSDPKVFGDKLNSLSTVVVPQDRVEEVMDELKADHVDLFANLPQGFVGSPIYSIRLIFAQWEADRYRGLKDRKKMMELRLLHLTLLKENGNTDVDVEKEIIYLQKRVSDIDFNLDKIEASIK